jgi:hypothetical protein
MPNFLFSNVLLKNRPATGNEVDEDHNDGNHQQDVNEPAHGVTGYQAEQP